MKRKIIQIAAAGLPECSDHASFLAVYALCEDGTVWTTESSTASVGIGFSWVQLAEIPDAPEPDF